MSNHKYTTKQKYNQQKYSQLIYCLWSNWSRRTTMQQEAHANGADE